MLQKRIDTYNKSLKRGVELYRRVYQVEEMYKQSHRHGNHRKHLVRGQE